MAKLPTSGASLDQSSEIVAGGNRTATGRGSDLDWASWNAAGRPDIFWGSHPKLQSLRAYMQGVSSATARGCVRAAVRKGAGRGWRGMNPRIRLLAHDAIFQVMDHWESQGGGRPDHLVVVQLRVALNLVLDDLGWNEKPAPALAAASVAQ